MKDAKGIILRRARGLCAEIDVQVIDTFCQNLREVAKCTSMYLAVASLRLRANSINTSSRFHTSPRGCLF
eukprot:991132-Pyramimonas_sp.AAC.1